MPYRYSEDEEDKKELGENNLKRSVHSDVSVYKQDDNPSASVYRRKTAQTIVPRDSEADQSLGSQDRMAGEPTQYMASGGFVDPEDSSQLLNSLTPGTSQQMAPPMPPPLPTRAPMAQQIPQAPMQQPPAPPAQSPIKLPGMPPGITPDELQSYLGKQRESLNKYGPEDQIALENQTLKERNGLGSRLTSGAKGFADALMMGVAGAGNPGWQKSYEDRQDRIAAEKMGTLEKAQAGNLQRTEAGMKLDAMDPSSPLSKESQDSFSPVLLKLGIQPDAIKKMSAAQMQSVMESSLKYGEISGNDELKKATLELQAMIGNANISNQKMQREQAAKGQKIEAAKAVLGGSKIPFVGPSHKQKVEAQNELSNQAAGIQDFDSEEEAAAAGLSDGTPVIIGGVKGKWSHR